MVSVVFLPTNRTQRSFVYSLAFPSGEGGPSKTVDEENGSTSPDGDQIFFLL